MPGQGALRIRVLRTKKKVYRIRGDKCRYKGKSAKYNETSATLGYGLKNSKYSDQSSDYEKWLSS